ncbi:Bacteroides conjugative transposon TraM protein [Chitinophaga eiseniae]|uniref:Bacteroides conjugative transposon TraM protein n=1 Tax=Chitinophaga eiseniae TaxID=634771 RepID=A0A1T4MNY0_9BACT|nr:conjugative transposon protein TraM [Chitinophaga eiseniae]SJZ68428.1 Bacteroides conjugative transposon TraM protein [Chitinophaga eiseniae]
MDNLQQSSSEELLRKRKFAIILPLIVFPFATLIFWLLGGGSGTAAPASHKVDAFNYELPAPILPDESKMNKLDYYEKAARDSAKWQDIARHDPNYNKTTRVDNDDIDFRSFVEAEKARADEKGGVVESPFSPGNEPDENVRRVNRKLAEINRELDKSTASMPAVKEGGPDKNSSVGVDTTDIRPDVAQLEKIMEAMQDKAPEDPEMTKIDGMLEKILDIQYPSRVREKMRKLSSEHQEQVYPVSSFNNDALDVSTLQPTQRSRVHIGDTVFSVHQAANGFYSLDDAMTDIEEENAVEAVVPETQTLVTGATLKLRLTRDVYIAGRLVPKDTYVYGAVSISGERLQVDIRSIRYSNSILPIAISAYDLDGMAGIYVPGAIARDVSKNSADQAIQGLGIMSMDPSLGAQAASAGIETAKTLLSRKVKLIKVTVKAGYQVLLKNSQS